MPKIIMTAKERIEKAKSELKKAQEKVRKLEGQRKLEVADILFEAIPDIGDYDDAALEKIFKESFDKLKTKGVIS